MLNKDRHTRPSQTLATLAAVIIEIFNKLSYYLPVENRILAFYLNRI